MDETEGTAEAGTAEAGTAEAGTAEAGTTNNAPGATALGANPDAAASGDQSNAGNGDAPSGTEGSPAGKDAGGADDNGSTGAPEAYADFALPEGVEMDTALLEAATPVFQELNLTQEQAQKLIDLRTEQDQADVQAQVDSFNQQLDDWLTEARADKEIGGDNFDASVKQANKALDTFGGPEIRALMDDYGIGNHPGVIKMLARVGATLKEDNPGGDAAPAAASRDRKSIMYGTQES